MKPQLGFIFFLLCLVLIGAIYVLVLENNTRTEIQLKEIEGLKKQIQVERDSMTRVYELRGDSLSIALHTIALNHAETEKAKARSAIEMSKLKDIIFIQYFSNHQRDSALKQLYPTFKPL